MTEIVDLWPDKIKVDKVITPVIILRQQASLLGKKTKNIVQADVLNVKIVAELYDFHYALYLVASALNNYRYRLLDIFYNVSPLYPMKVEVESDIYNEISSKFKSPEQNIGAFSEEDFKNILREIFNSAKVKRIISVLLSQSDPSYDPSLKEEETQ